MQIDSSLRSLIHYANGHRGEKKKTLMQISSMNNSTCIPLQMFIISCGCNVLCKVYYYYYYWQCIKMSNSFWCSSLYNKSQIDLWFVFCFFVILKTAHRSLGGLLKKTKNKTHVRPLVGLHRQQWLHSTPPHTWEPLWVVAAACCCGLIN